MDRAGETHCLFSDQLCVYTYIDMCVHIFVCIYIFVYTCIYIYMYTCIFMHYIDISLDVIYVYLLYLFICRGQHDGWISLVEEWPSFHRTSYTQCKHTKYGM